MKTRNNPNNIQESILDTLDLIKETPVNSFFKQRVLKQLLQEKDLKESSFVESKISIGNICCSTMLEYRSHLFNYFFNRNFG